MASEDHDTLIDIPSSVSTGANLVGMHNYLAMWEKSVNDPQAFWMEQARLHRLHRLPPPPPSTACLHRLHRLQRPLTLRLSIRRARLCTACTACAPPPPRTREGARGSEARLRVAPPACAPPGTEAPGLDRAAEDDDARRL